MEQEKYRLKTLKDIGKISSDGILAFDLAANSVCYNNKALAGILEISATDLKKAGTNALRKALKDDDEFLKGRFDELMEKSKIMNLELRIDADSEKYISCDAYFISKSNMIIAFVKDITLAKQHLNYIAEFGARKNTILDMVVHNLSGPLNITNNLLDIIDQVSRDQRYKKIDSHTRLIRENTQHCIEQINAFMKEEHFTSPDIPRESNRFDAVAKITIIVERFKQFAPSKQIKFTSPAKELFVTGDDVKFFQIVNNLISNAIKFTDEKGRILIKVSDEKDTFSVSVSDNGIGIPDYLQPFLFTKNSPAGRQGLRGEKSLGMGLYVVKKLVDLMKGSIRFESEENKGSTFIVEFPKSY
jgi:two-component system sensor histidine kinase VicK